MARNVSTAAVAIAFAGAVTTWAAVKGVGVASGVRALLAGHTLPTGEDLTQQSDGTGAGGTTAASNNAVASQGLSYVDKGHKYRWGGGSPDGWDCSGFVNYVLCHDLGIDIPGYKGGSFDGDAHGPVTLQWSIAPLPDLKREQVDAGDLVIWPLFHMGIAISNTQMVHAPGPNGTPAPIVGKIDGAAKGIAFYRRLVVPDSGGSRWASPR